MRVSQKWVLWLSLAGLLLTAGGSIWLLQKGSVASKVEVQSEQQPVVNEPKPTPVVTTATLRGSLLFLGDIMLARSIGPKVVAGQDPLAGVREVMDDYSVVVGNMETVIADPEIANRAKGKLYAFNAPLGVLSWLKSSELDVVVLANNHTMDFGAAALEDTRARLKKVGLLTVGAGTNIDEAFRPLVVEVPVRGVESEELEAASGIRVGLIAFNEVETYFTAASETGSGSAWYDQARLKRSIARAKEEGVEVIVALPHWGQEYVRQPNQQQKKVGRWLVDQGVDMVIGNHPHVRQPMEVYKGKPIVYSLGNLVFDQMDGAEDGQMVGMIMETEVRYQDGVLLERGPVEVQPLKLIKTWLKPNGFAGLEKK